MAGTKISALPVASALTGTELVPVVQSGNTVQTTVGAVNTLALSGNAATATTATNIAGGAAGSVPYQTGSGTTALLAAGTSSQVLVSGATPAFTNTPALTGTNFTGIPNAALTNITTSTTDTVQGNISRTGDWGIGTTAVNIPDFTDTNTNFARIGRALSTAVGGSGVAMGVVGVPYDGTPVTQYLGITPGGAGAQRLWAGNKGSSGGTPTWTEFARVNLPTFTSNIGLGTISTTYALQITSPTTGGTTAGAINIAPTIQSDVTTNAYGALSSLVTAAASFTLNAWRGFQAGVNTVGAGSTVTNAYGFIADSSLGTGATNSYGFYHSIAAGTNKWGIYALGTASNYINGSVGLGTTTLTGYTFRNLLNLTGATTAYQNQSGGVVQSDVTANAVYNATNAGTAAAAFVVPNLIHYQAVQGTFGAGSTVTTQSGFVADATLIGAGTANYGFRGSIPASALLRYNLYMDGTAPNYMAGALSIGTPTSTAYTLRNAAVITGATTAFGHSEEGVIQSGVTVAGYYNSTAASTVAAVFTLPTLVHYRASQGTFGAGSVITNQTGFSAEATLIGGGTSNYGFRGAIPSSATRWNVFMDGTAQNFFQGNVGIGTGKTAPAFPLDVAGTINATYLAGAAANALSAAGTTLATATVLAAQFNAVATVGAGSGVALPNVIGVPIWVFNNQATNALLVYPFSASQTINALAAGAGFSLAAASKIQLVQVATNVWFTMT